MQEHASSLVTSGFVVIPLLMVGVMSWAVRHAAPEHFGKSCVVAVVWLALWAGLAIAGVLGRFVLRPPPFMLVVVCTLAGGLWLGLSPLGGQMRARCRSRRSCWRRASACRSSS